MKDNFLISLKEAPIEEYVIPVDLPSPNNKINDQV